MKGGTTNGQCPVCRYTVPPHGISGFHQPDARRISAVGAALRGGVPSAYGRVAPRWETANRPPVCRLQKLSPADTRRAALLYSDLCENLCAASGPGTPVRHGPEQSQSV